MASQEYYYNLIKKQQEAQKNKDIADIKAQTDAQKKIVEENYNSEVGNTAEAYDILHRKNAVQKELNQRHIERKAAEMGLTDSGFNRTQQTAAQLSYANQSAEYSRQEQKAVDTLAATMRAKITELETNQNTNINSIERAYDQSATEQATKLRQADVDAAAKVQAARIAAESKLEMDIDYSTFSGSDWVEFFSEIKNTHGSLWAIETINDYASRGILPAQYAKQAAAAVRGGRVGG